MWPKKVAIDFQIPLAVILTIPPFSYPVNLAVSKFTVEQGERVLVTAPTNPAVDNMVEKLSNVGINIVRVGNPARISKTVASKSLAEIVNAKMAPFREEFETKKSDLRKDLRHCLKDDSLAAGIRQLLKKLAKSLKKQVKHGILAGDQCQLPLVIFSRKALEGGLGISLLERDATLHEGILTTTLTTQYQHLDPTGTGSLYNEGEADIVLQHVFSLIYAGVSPNAIVVQSPYVSQVQLLRDMLDGVPEAAGTEVSTIDSFQGREVDAVILSMPPTQFASWICIS
ncbi:hypothetical protein P8452_61539 [Trifolium repens]|nr:hypothetical protein P8452_61539 [Trifolium repens]